MEFDGTFDDTGVTSDLMVNIEGSLFFVANENIRLFEYSKPTEGNKEVFTLAALELEEQYVINLSTYGNVGHVSTDYRGITLNNDLDCEFKTVK